MRIRELEVRFKPYTESSSIPSSARMLCSRHVVDELRERFEDKCHEEFVAIYLDSRHRPLGLHVLGKGTVNTCPVRPADAFGTAYLLAAKAVVFAHNHPSGDAAPSGDDRTLTARLVAGGQLLSIEVLDHVIIAGDTYYSFADEGELE